jgi:hypothetical protein
MMNLTPFLEDLERRIDADVEHALWADWRAFCDGRAATSVFSPRRRRPAPSTLAWPEVMVNQALADRNVMALQQLRGCSAALADGSGALLCVRCNYGTPILPTLFGARQFMMSDASNTLPASHALDGGAAAIRTVVERGVPATTNGLWPTVLAMARHFQALFDPYPNLRRFVTLYHPDLQGPLDVVEMLWGSDIFYALIDTPELVHQLLDVVTETYTTLMTEWESLVPPATDGYTVHWSMLHKGRLMLRDDSAMNLSATMFCEFVQPYDQRLLQRFGGGAIHFCGRGDHFLPHMTQMPGLHAINMSQPELNDMELCFTHTIDRGIRLIGLARAAVEAAVARGRDLRGLVHCP